MTLNDFVAYIQFLTAFYISLGFEKLVDKIFFSDSYRRNVEILLDNIISVPLKWDELNN